MVPKGIGQEGNRNACTLARPDQTEADRAAMASGALHWRHPPYTDHVRYCPVGSAPSNEREIVPDSSTWVIGPRCRLRPVP